MKYKIKPQTHLHLKRFKHNPTNEINAYIKKRKKKLINNSLIYFVIVTNQEFEAEKILRVTKRMQSILGWATLSECRQNSKILEILRNKF
jgi:hypothetical protein